MDIEALYRRPNTSKPSPRTRFISICCGSCPSSGPTRSGRSTSPASLLSANGCICLPSNEPRAASSTWLPCWTVTSASKLSGRRSHVTASPRYSAAIGAASSHRPTTSRCWPPTRSRSAWMARTPDAITSSWSACGEPSNTTRSTCGPTPACPRPAPASNATSASTTAACLIHRLTEKLPVRRPSTSRCPKRRRHNRGGDPLRKRPDPVQINRATSPGFLVTSRKSAYNFRNILSAAEPP